MNKIVNQFRRIFSDDGRSDHDFSDQEFRLHEAQQRLYDATEELKRSSEQLNDVVSLNFILAKSH